MSTKPSLAELLLARENEIKGAIIALQRELDGVHAAQQAYFSIVQAEASDNSDAADDKTIKEMIVEVLKGRPEGETSDAIIGLILKFFGREIPRTSLSPQLSRLKAQDNRVFYNEETRTWSLNEYRGDTKKRWLERSRAAELDKLRQKETSHRHSSTSGVHPSSKKISGDRYGGENDD